MTFTVPGLAQRIVMHTGQSHLDIGAGEDFEEIVIVPASGEAFPLDSSLKAFVLFEKVKSNMPNDGNVLGGESLPNPTVVFTEGHVKTPVESILDAPMASDGLRYGFGGIRDAGDKQATHSGDFFSYMTLAFHHGDALEI